MLKIISIFVILVLLESCTGSKKTLPVFLIDHDAVMVRLTMESNPFDKISSNFFTELALDAGNRTECVVIFIEELLCTEDISCKDGLGTPYYNLQEGLKDKKVLYMPAVSEPYDLLREVFEPHVSNIFHLGSGEKLSILDHHKYIYVYFQDDSEMSRLETLRKHDMLMKEVYFTVRQLKAGPIFAFYTGKKNPVTVAELKHSPGLGSVSPQARGAMVVTPEALFRLSGVFSSTKTRRSTFEETPVVEYEMRTRRTLSTTMLVTDFHLQFNFEFEYSKWKLANVALLEAGEEVGRTETDIDAPWRRSYYCSEPITIFNLRDGSSITISEYQIEPLAQTRRSGDYDGLSSEAAKDKPALRDGEEAPSATSAAKPGHCAFSTAINCGPYFNTVILSGIFLVSVLLIIAFWGVLMLFNCGTNDRYDDPSQKPLVIAQEVGGG